MRNALAASGYRLLSPEERFRLILAAGGRDDDVERERLVGSCQRVSRTLPDYYPFCQAFQELTFQTYLELLDIVGQLLESIALADACGYDSDENAAEVPPDRPASESTTRRKKQPPGQRFLDTAYAAGYMLKTKAAGWTTFCDRLHIPPYLLWTVLPGYDRYRRALVLAETVAFDAEDFRRWRDRVRPKDEHARAELVFTAESETDKAEALFRERVKWWSG